MLSHNIIWKLFKMLIRLFITSQSTTDNFSNKIYMRFKEKKIFAEGGHPLHPWEEINRNLFK